MRTGRLLGGLLLAPTAILAGLAGFSAWTGGRIARAFPAQGRSLDLGGERIHVVEAGSGPPIVLVHGLRSSVATFTYAVMETLARDHRVIAIDRPGSGHSPRASGGGAGPRAQAGTIARAIEALRLERPLVVGHSLGGAIALALALDHPDQVGGLALVAPLTQVETAPPPVFRLLAVRSPILRVLAGWTVAVPAAILGRTASMEALFGPEPVPDAFATRGGGLLALRPASFIAASTDLAAINGDLPGMIARYGTLACPVGVLFGSGDRILDPGRHADRVRGAVPDVEIEIIDGAGHMLPLTRPEETVSFIRRQAARIGAA